MSLKERIIQDIKDSFQIPTNLNLETTNKSTLLQLAQEIVKKFFAENKNITYRYLKSEKNFGVAHVRNIGIKESKAEYLAFLDADDIWYSNKLQKVSNILVNDASLDLVCHDEIMKVDNKVIGRMHCDRVRGDIYFNLLFKGCFIYTSSVVVKKSKIIEAGLFSEDFFGVEDYECWLRLALSSKIIFLNIPLGEYRIGKLTIMSNIENTIKYVNNIVDIHYRNFYKKNDIKSKLYLRMRKAGILFEGASHAYYRRLWFKSLKYCIKSLFLNPLLFRSYFLILRIFFNLLINKNRF